MKKNLYRMKTISFLLTFTLILTAFVGCGQNQNSGNPSESSSVAAVQQSSSSPASPSASDTESGRTEDSFSPAKEGKEKEEEIAPSVSSAANAEVLGSSSKETPDHGAEQLTVRFGNGGAPFTMHLYNNATAEAIARHVGTASWQLPIYHYDDYDNWEVMQYYDIPSRYEIPSNAESISSEAAGTVYYSEPNRIVLFFHEAQVSGEYTPVGYFDYTDDFVAAVEENPVLEGWGNKLVFISQED